MAAERRALAASPKNANSAWRIEFLNAQTERLGVIGRALEPLHDVLVANRAVDALERLDNGERFDVILCDLMMPELSGVDFHRALRQRAPLAAERIVFVTGGVFSSEAREFLEPSRQERLDKPFDVGVLRALVKQRIQPAPRRP